MSNLLEDFPRNTASLDYDVNSYSSHNLLLFFFQFSEMGNFAMTIWNSTYNPCFSTFDQFFFCVSWIKNSFFLLFIEA
jgi:hypothetical protein